jgi:membrane protease subunit (stomatin/prohibitin family)
MEQQAEQQAIYDQGVAAAQQQAAAAAPPAGGTDVVAELQKLGSLKEAGILTDAEFAAAKAKLLA